MTWMSSEASDVVPEVYEDSTVTSGPPTQREVLKEEPNTDDEVPSRTRREEDSEDEEPQLTGHFKKFSEEVRRLSEEAGHEGCELEVKTYFDLQGYDLDSFASRARKQPGALLMMYMFYSRIFEKLVGKQKGVEVPFFAPVNLDERLLGFRAVLEWAKDFKLMPSRV
ncbi:unnamed protein product, partial [Effrenium voratum]